MRGEYGTAGPACLPRGERLRYINAWLHPWWGKA